MKRPLASIRGTVTVISGSGGTATVTLKTLDGNTIGVLANDRLDTEVVKEGGAQSEEGRAKGNLGFFIRLPSLVQVFQLYQRIHTVSQVFDLFP